MLFNTVYVKPVIPACNKSTSISTCLSWIEIRIGCSFTLWNHTNIGLYKMNMEMSSYLSQACLFLSIAPWLQYHCKNWIICKFPVASERTHPCQPCFCDPALFQGISKVSRKCWLQILMLLNLFIALATGDISNRMKYHSFRVSFLIIWTPSNCTQHHRDRDWWAEPKWICSCEPRNHCS